MQIKRKKLLETGIVAERVINSPLWGIFGLQYLFWTLGVGIRICSRLSHTGTWALHGSYDFMHILYLYSSVSMLFCTTKMLFGTGTKVMSYIFPHAFALLLVNNIDWNRYFYWKNCNRGSSPLCAFANIHNHLWQICHTLTRNLNLKTTITRLMRHTLE